MDAVLWARARPVFEAALDRPVPERDDFIELACTGDDALREAVRRLVAAADDERPVLADLGLSGFARLLDSEVGDAAGRRIGPYRITGLLGVGGMGAVYLAERDDGEYEHRVAIKMVRTGPADGDAIARIRRERQILALLNHPDIARLLDGGEHEGVPYLVMEYVEGEPIDVYCDRHRLAIADRIGLFIDVCNAVDYAHRNLVVHRDLKPGNILIASDGRVKLLDFGIARMLEHGAADRSATRTGQSLLTPEYASPEQIRGSPVTTTSDVYGLGAVLYRLLTGRVPHAVAGLSAAAIERMVCDTSPERPGAIDRSLRGDIDAILMKALRHGPDRRYGSARELADDLRAHLERRPIQARPDTTLYRLYGFARRHTTGVVAACVVLVAIVGGGVTTAYQAARAQRSYEDVRTLANALLFDLHDAVRDLPGGTEARRLLVQRAITYLDLLRTRSPADATLQLELAAAWEQVGEIQGDPHYTNLGDLAGTLASYASAFDLRHAVWQRDTTDPVGRHALGRSYGHLAVATSWNGDNARAIRLSRRAVELLEPLAGGANAAVRADLGRIEAELGWWLIWAGEVDAGLGHVDSGVGLLTDVLATGTADIDIALDLWRAWSYRVDGLRFTARHAEALALLRDTALPHLLDLERTHPRHPQVQYGLHVCNDFIGAMHAELGDYESATPAFGEALAIAERMVETDPANHKAIEGLARSYASLGDVLVRAGTFDAGVASFTRAIDVHTRLHQRNPANVELANMLGNANRRLCRVLHEAARERTALGYCLDSEAVLEDAVAANSENAVVRANLASTWVASARVYSALAALAQLDSAGALIRHARDRYGRGLDMLRSLAGGEAVPDLDPAVVAAELAALDARR